MRELYHALYVQELLLDMGRRGDSTHSQATVYNGGIRVPAFVKIPSSIQEGNGVLIHTYIHIHIYKMIFHSRL